MAVRILEEYINWLDIAEKMVEATSKAMIHKEIRHIIRRNDQRYYGMKRCAVELDAEAV